MSELDRARRHLESDVFRNIALLKMLELFGETGQVAVDVATDGDAVLLALPVDISPYDRDAYPEFDRVVFLSSTSAESTRALVGRMPAGYGERLVFKVLNAADRAIVEQRFSVRRHVAFISYTTDGSRRFVPHDLVECTTTPDDATLALLESQGYARDWCARMLTRGDAVVFVREKSSIGIAYRNFDRVWELGALFTVPEKRRIGLSRSIVETALAWVLERRLLPRYQVIETNEASRALAVSLGLEPFLVIEHLLTQ